MPSSSERANSATPTSAKITRGHSCLACYQRKVKCDGKRPCSTCIRSGVECRSGKSERRSRNQGISNSRKLDKLSFRLRRCEELLVAHGVPMEKIQAIVDDENMLSTASASLDGSDSHMILQRGHPRFVDNAVWKCLGDELSDNLQLGDDHTDFSDEEPSLIGDEVPAAAETLIFGRPPFTKVNAHHPTMSQILMLWQTFLNNVNPLVKIFHAPTIQNVISEALIDLSKISASIEALMFSIYLSAVTTLEDFECLRITGEAKRTLVSRYSNATQQALANAQFLKSTDIAVLQALTIYLLANRSHIDAQSLWILSGVTSRLAETIGLHRESNLKQLPPFEAEIRRRLWWQIQIIDNRSAQLSGAAIESGFSTTWDTRRPLNLNDSDLSPYMRELPPEHNGVTEMLFCTVRFEIGKCMRQLQMVENTSKVAGAVALTQNERIFDECEDRLNRLLEKCDSSIPLHLLATLMGRSALCLLRFNARQPMHLDRDLNSTLAQTERDSLFTLALEIVTCDSSACSNKALQPFFWHVVLQFPFQAFIYLLTELLHRVQGEEVDRAWLGINQAYENHPEFIQESKNRLHVALGNLTLKAWGKRLIAAGQNPSTGSSTEPAVIQSLRAQRRPKAARSTGNASATPSESISHLTYEPLFEISQNERDGVTDFSSPSFLSDTMLHFDWNYWNGLLQDSGESSNGNENVFPGYR